MDTINISEFKATCLAQLRRVEQTGRPLLILRHGVPIAQILPPPLPEPMGSWLGCLKKAGTIDGDLTEPIMDSDRWEAHRL